MINIKQDGSMRGTWALVGRPWLDLGVHGHDKSSHPDPVPYPGSLRRHYVSLSKSYIFLSLECRHQRRLIRKKNTIAVGWR